MPLALLTLLERQFMDKISGSSPVDWGRQRDSLRLSCSCSPVTLGETGQTFSSAKFPFETEIRSTAYRQQNTGMSAYSLPPHEKLYLPLFLVFWQTLNPSEWERDSSTNHRKGWAGKDFKDYLVPTPLPLTGTPSMRSGCSKPQPT